MRNLQPKFTIFFPLLLLTLIACFFAFLVPVYQGPDEQIHYATVQYQAEPEDKAWPILEDELTMNNGENIASFHFSEEVIQGGKLNQFDEIKWQGENTQQFSTTGQVGVNEISFNQEQFKRYIDIYPSNASGTKSFYYTLGSQIERLASGLSFSERFFLARLLSVALYLGVVIMAYLVAKTIFPSPLKQILFALLIAFQPMLLATGTIVNIDIALIFSFSLFFLGALRILKEPTSKFFHLLTLLSLILAFYSKGPGIALIPVALVLYSYLFQQKYQLNPVKLARILVPVGALLIILFFLIVPESFLISITNLGAVSKFTSPFTSLSAYIDKTISVDAFLRTHASYWGNFGWLDTKVNTLLLHGIALLELIAWIGIAFFLFSKKIKVYLPEKPLILLSLGMILALQLAIRFYDWRVFDATGKILIGTPGRYFLPTIIPHFLILITGLGLLFTKNKYQFTTLLKTLVIGMILLCLYSIFNVIIPRYYL